MAFWIYKCNSRAGAHQVTWGDWDDLFSGQSNGEWGSTELVPELANARPGDAVLAYQTNRKELVGIAEVVRFRRRGAHKEIILRPIEELRVKIPPLKKQSSAVARIRALQPGWIQTLYPLSKPDFDRLLRAARAQYKSATQGPNAEPRAMEGLFTETTSYSRGRSRKLRNLALQNARNICEACCVDFGRVLGGKGVRVLQVHHRKQFAATDAPRVTRLSDLAVLCANCHMLVHVNSDGALPVEKLRKMLRRGSVGLNAALS